MRSVSVLTLAGLLLGLVVLVACSDETNTTVIDGLDCGLVREDLAGTWVVDFVTATRTLTNCEDPADDGTSVTVPSPAISFANVGIDGSQDSASFGVFGRTASYEVDPELTVGVNADSCLALARVWIQSEDLFVLCLGTFDRGSRTINAFCDSVEVDFDVDETIDNSCDVNITIDASIGVI